MDNNNISVRFLGHFSDGTMKNALKHRENLMDLKTFFNAVNQTNDGGCSCCKQDVKVYCIMPLGIPQIKPTTLSLCYGCLKALPEPLRVINIDSNGCPPTLVYKIYESEV